ncbi:hypothetical protein [Companilactobacillus nantensis]|uniref:Uncharacterized protein n=1 Tax=Companilactobacillus nantensis DSM 16982 TaxID=1423774 RepID=A0A0R1WJK2_9LACO|nr:hypothetical protein [Companilactobacillus nantensis]KRM15945.1 hypothetical protein FD31_GL000844 [Companilactobacillus nantensis DSM 16982]GEO64817.1 hypothetical protein LNA01_20000 [Companilactobacillus nantensis]
MTLTIEDKNYISQAISDAMNEEEISRVSPGWKFVSKEIRDFCYEEMDYREKTLGYKQRGFDSIKNAFYIPIKVICNVSNVLDISNDESMKARRIFLNIKEEMVYERSRHHKVGEKQYGY